MLTCITGCGAGQVQQKTKILSNRMLSSNCSCYNTSNCDCCSCNAIKLISSLNLHFCHNILYSCSNNKRPVKFELMKPLRLQVVQNSVRGTDWLFCGFTRPSVHDQLDYVTSTLAGSLINSVTTSFISKRNSSVQPFLAL